MEELNENEMKGVQGGACINSNLEWYREEGRTENSIRFQMGKKVDHIIVKEMIPNYVRNEIRLYRGDTKKYSVGHYVTYGEIRFYFLSSGYLRIGKKNIKETLRFTLYLYAKEEETIGVTKNRKKITISI